MSGKDVRQEMTWGTRLRFLVRVLGLTGVLTAAAGGVLTATVFTHANAWTSDNLRGALHGDHGEFARNAVWILAIGAVAIALAAVTELIGLVVLAAGRRTVAGTTATVGVVAATALLVFVNAYSFSHYRRYDCTGDRQFTLPPRVAEELGKLRPDSPTTVVVLQKHKTFGTNAETRDSYASAAEQKVAEKVRDLVDQFREFGGRFKVTVLDTESFKYQQELAELTAKAPELRAAIEAAPENSIFFHANKRVQRLGFDEFLQLDRTGSKESDGGRGNLVLRPQGVERFAQGVLAVQPGRPEVAQFARRVLSGEERRPRVAVCVAHEWLATNATEGQAEYSAAGLRKALTDHGFEVTDVILKRFGRPAAYTLAETRLERLEAELEDAETRIRANGVALGQVRGVRKALEEVASRPIDIRLEAYNQLLRLARGRVWLDVLAVYEKWLASEKLSEKTEPEFRQELLAGLDRQAARIGGMTEAAEKDRQAAEAQVRGALKNERALQDRRVTDVKAKLTKLLADVDLLIIPRHTVVNATIGSGIPTELYPLSTDQVEVIKEFMKTGKPVLALLGPISNPDTNGPDLGMIDGFEQLLTQRGVVLGKETILFDGESKAFAARKAGELLGGAGPTDIPPLDFRDLTTRAGLAPNPIGAAIRLTGRSLAEQVEIRLRAPRPVSLLPGLQDKLPFAAEFVLTSPDAWNEIKPFPEISRVGARLVLSYRPEFNPAEGADPKNAGLGEKRRGPFSVGIAIDSELPVEWFLPENPPLPELAQALAGGLAVVVLPQLPDRSVRGYDWRVGLAAALTPLDHGISAALLTDYTETRYPRPDGRLVVLGQGGLFAGAELKPSQEKLLLHCVNWLLKRPDRLPSAPEAPEAVVATGEVWKFPRVTMTDRDIFLWRAGTAVGLPLLAVYLGVLAMMVRRLR